MIAVKAPSVGESITEVSILKWHKQNGEAVKTGEVLLEIESDKATVEIVAEGAGVLQILKPQGERINVGTVIAQIDPSGKATAASTPKSAPAAGATKATPPAPSAAQSATMTATATATPSYSANPHSALPLSPAARKAVVENQVDPAQVSGTGKDGRLTKGDVLNHVQNGGAPKSPLPTPAAPTNPGDRRVPMSMLRQRIAERLVMAQHTAAILTTFNEVDMGPVMELRNKNKDAFKAKHGVPLSFMSFFTLAAIEALKLVPEVNASIDGKDVVYHDYHDIGIAVGTERGLVVPVVRGADKMKVVDIEKRIGELAVKARDGKLGIADMSGGTFTISNGGVYGSLLSTPILNPPQSGILGMHNIVERPMAVDGKVVIRPMMYLALSYDHRIVDGKGAVTFLVKLKEFLEHPDQLKLTF